MGKYIICGIIILLVLFIIEYFQIFDVPFIEIPDFTSGKEKMIIKTVEAIG